MRRFILSAGLCVLCLLTSSTARADIVYAGTANPANIGVVDGASNILYVDEGNPFDFSTAGVTEGLATEFNFWAGKPTGFVTPFIAEVIADNDFIVRAIGTTREGGTDWNATGLQQFAFNDDDQPTIQDGWVSGFVSSHPDGTGGESPVPFIGSDVSGWLTFGDPKPTITVGEAPTLGGGMDDEAFGNRQYQFQIGVEVEGEVVLPPPPPPVYFAGTNPVTDNGGADGWKLILYINEQDTFDFSAAGQNEGFATEFNFWADRAIGVVTPFVVEVVAENEFIVQAIGTTREGGTDFTDVGLQSFPFSDEGTPTVSDGWAVGFLSSFPDGSGGEDGSPIPFAGNAGVAGWLAGSSDASGGPTITLGEAPTEGDNATNADAYGFRRYAFNVIAETTKFTLNGGGQTHFEDFDSMGTSKTMPRGWKAEDNDGSARINSLGLSETFVGVGSPADGNIEGVVNVGGNADNFASSGGDRVATWKSDLDGVLGFGEGDAIADGAVDRALGFIRANETDTGLLKFEVEISDNPLRAFVMDWDLEVWGGDQDASFRGDQGGGFALDVSVGGQSYYGQTESVYPGDLLDTIADQAGNEVGEPTLIDGNLHSVRGMSSGIREVSGEDGAVGNTVNMVFNADYSDGDLGWIAAIDNVRFRALAPGDADANGVVDVADLLQLLGGQKFNQGVADVTWEQGDFNADDQFNTGDLLAMLSFLSGTFPSDPYASEAGGASDAVADIIVNSETGEVTVDLAGHTVSAIIIESASEIFNGEQPAWDTTSQFPSTLPGELGNVLFTSTAAGVDELGAVISAEFLGRDKEFYLQDLDLNILIASEGGALTKGNVIVVPEPSTWMLLGLGSLALVGIVRRRRAC